MANPIECFRAIEEGYKNIILSDFAFLKGTSSGRNNDASCLVAAKEEEEEDVEVVEVLLRV